jgi:hypothetical protein
VNSFFQVLAAKLGDRWITFLLVPGAAFVAAVWAGAELGQAHAVDWQLLTQHASAATATFARHPATAQAVLVVVTMLAVAAVGLTVQALAGVTRTIWLGQWPGPFTGIRRCGVNRRLSRWNKRLADRRKLEANYPRHSRTKEQQLQIDLAARQLNRLSLAVPGRPTWMGDRVQGVERVALDRYGLDLTFAWPRLWLVLPETSRAEITAAHAEFAAAVVTGTWAWPYLLLGIAWWPALVVTAVVGVTGWARARSAIGELAALAESTLDLHGRDLAITLGVAEQDTVGPLSVAEGQKITALVRKGR